jgi:hypothetical protein
MQPSLFTGRQPLIKFKQDSYLWTIGFESDKAPTHSHWGETLWVWDLRKTICLWFKSEATRPDTRQTGMKIWDSLTWFRTQETNTNASSKGNTFAISPLLILIFRCDKSYLYPSSLKKHYTVSHKEEYEKYLDDQQSKPKHKWWFSF